MNALRFFLTPLGSILIVVIVLGLWGVGGLFLYYQFYVCSPSNAGTFGDMFGVINTLFGALTVAGVLLTVLHQRQEILEARAQLRFQRFETTFYQLLELHNEIIGFMTYGNFSGRACFKQYYNLDFEEIIVSYKKNLALPGTGDYNFNFTDMQGVAKDFFDKVDPDLGHYFRNLYEIITLVDSQSEEVLPDKKKYMRIVRAQLSAYEIALIFYYSFFSEYTITHFKPLIERYRLFSRFDTQLLKQPHHRGFYNQDVFSPERDDLN